MFFSLCKSLSMYLNERFINLHEAKTRRSGRKRIKMSKLSANILSFLGSSNNNATTMMSSSTKMNKAEIRPKAKLVSPTDANTIAKNRNGLVVVKDGLIGETLCREAFFEAEKIFKSGKLQQARMGKHSKIDTSYRADSIVWLTSEDDVVNKTKALKIV